ncbi:hypothetical protein E2C01_031413 [Portunus trituberculatus]|uniref:Uncharacterized protein n=1 Tax=Portunus trituberculatus TaxID=210409 RepID=A0A5B7EY25_PORTR|nr:hypothetical protein [Portunus trituberculatus]
MTHVAMHRRSILTAAVHLPLKPSCKVDAALSTHGIKGSVSRRPSSTHGSSQRHHTSPASTMS